MDLRLGLIDDRVSPALAHKLGRLAADLPHQPAIEQLAEQFDVRLSVDTYRKVVRSLSYEVRYLHDKVAIEQLTQWIAKAVGRNRCGGTGVGQARDSGLRKEELGSVAARCQAIRPIKRSGSSTMGN